MKKYFLILPILAMALMPFFASAQTFVTSVTGITGVTSVLDQVAGWFLIVVVTVSVIFFVYAGFLYITSGGDDDKIKKAKDYLLYGVIGIAVALLAKAITTVVMNLISGV